MVCAVQDVWIQLEYIYIFLLLFPFTVAPSLHISEKNTLLRRWSVDFPRLYLPPVLIYKGVTAAAAALWCPQPGLAPLSIHNANEVRAIVCQQRVVASRGRLFQGRFITASSAQTGELSLERRQTSSPQFLRWLRRQVWSHGCQSDAAFVERVVVICLSILLSVSVNISQWLILQKMLIFI